MLYSLVDRNGDFVWDVRIDCTGKRVYAWLAGKWVPRTASMVFENGKWADKAIEP
jgi:hypothetical protein